MAENSDRARASITEAMDKLKQVHADKPLSLVPQLFTEYKRDELVNIYEKKGTREEKDKAYEVLFAIDASQQNTWDKIKK